MKGKILNVIALFSSFLGYLEWGTNKSMFLFHAEYDILSKLFIKPLDVIHPLTILPLLGQFFLFITIFQKPTQKISTLIGISGIGLLYIILLLIGLIDLNWKIFFSTIPFLFISFIIIKERNKLFK